MRSSWHNPFKRWSGKQTKTDAPKQSFPDKTNFPLWYLFSFWLTDFAAYKFNGMKFVVFQQIRRMISGMKDNSSLDDDDGGCLEQTAAAMSNRIYALEQT